MEDHISNKISENPPESMPSTGMVYNASAEVGERVLTKDGITIAAADVGAVRMPTDDDTSVVIDCRNGANVKIAAGINDDIGGSLQVGNSSGGMIYVGGGHTDAPIKIGSLTGSDYKMTVNDSDVITANSTNSFAQGILAATTSYCDSKVGYTNTFSTSSNTLSLDRSVQYVQLTGLGDLTIAAPTRTYDAARDFVVYVYTDGTNHLNLAALDHIKAADDAATNACEVGFTMLMFTELTTNIWVVGRQNLKTLK